jgi:starch-binding outer membrane protein, SusD/RagB family
MKKFRINYIIGLLAPILFLSSCKEEFLDRPPKDAITAPNYFQNDAQLASATAGLYSITWFTYNDEASFNLGDFRGGSTFSAYSSQDNVTFATNGATSQNGAAWRSFFIVVGQANSVIENVKKYSGPQVTERAKKVAIAEARYMRALAYRFLVMNWGPVPIIENHTNLLDNPLEVKRNTVSSVWKFITREMRAAAEDLPVELSQPGRLTQAAAEGMLARFYLTRAGVESSSGARNQVFLDSAKYYSEKVITSGTYKLLDNYYDLFKVPYDNNSESMFSLQWTFNSDWGYGNSALSHLIYDGSISNGDGWGGDKGATLWMLQQYEGLVENGRTLDKRLYATYFMPGATYPDIQIGDEVKKPLVFPYRNENTNFASIKKYISGPTTDAQPSAPQKYDQDTYMMRLAEMYLIYAEAALGNNAETNDAKALQYLDRIRYRAGLPQLTVGNTTTLRPITLDDILKERFTEFAMEGMIWYDMVNLHYWNPTKAYSIISNQDRGFYKITPDNFPNVTKWTVAPNLDDNTRKFQANEGNFYLPIPDAELSQSPNLREEPIDYVAK